jgi:hypothetical protein
MKMTLREQLRRCKRCPSALRINLPRATEIREELSGK